MAREFIPFCPLRPDRKLTENLVMESYFILILKRIFLNMKLVIPPIFSKKKAQDAQKNQNKEEKHVNSGDSRTINCS